MEQLFGGSAGQNVFRFGEFAIAAADEEQFDGECDAHREQCDSRICILLHHSYK